MWRKSTPGSISIRARVKVRRAGGSGDMIQWHAAPSGYPAEPEVISPLAAESVEPEPGHVKLEAS